MKTLNEFLNIVENKKELKRLTSFIEQEKKAGIKDSFRISQLCIMWSRLAGCPAYDFRTVLENHLSN